MYTGRTPYAGACTSSKDARHVKPILEYYINLEQDEQRAYLATDWPGSTVPAGDG
jgi:hypothetical protein